MIYVITLLISAIIWIGVLDLQNMHGMGAAWRMTVLIYLLIFGCAFIFCGVIAPPEPRAVLFQVGAAFLTTIPICIAYVAYKNRRGW